MFRDRELFLCRAAFRLEREREGEGEREREFLCRAAFHLSYEEGIKRKVSKRERYPKTTGLFTNLGL